MILERTVARLAAGTSEDDWRRAARDVGHELLGGSTALRDAFRSAVAQLEGGPPELRAFRSAILEVVAAFDAATEGRKETT